MPAECPNCHQPIPRIRLFFTSAWGRWNCSRCGAVLGIDVRRRLLATVPWVAILFVLLGVLKITALGYAIAIPMIVGAGFVNFVLFDRAVVHERTGFRCRTCGYDLQGQTEPRCPECGSEFDAAELAAYKAGDPRRPAKVPWYRSAVAITVVLSVLFLLTLAGVFYLSSMKPRAPGRRPAATQPTTRPASMMTPSAASPGVPGPPATAPAATNP